MSSWDSHEVIDLAGALAAGFDFMEPYDENHLQPQQKYMVEAFSMAGVKSQPTHRTFLPKFSFKGIKSHMIDIIHHSSPFSYMYQHIPNGSGKPPIEEPTVAVSIDSAYQHIGPTASAGIGIYFGPSSPHNRSLPLSRSHPHQSDPRAMIQAAITALKIVRKAVDPEITKTVIVSNNKDMVMSITEWVFTWKKDGWDKIPEVLSEYRAKNRDLLEKLDGLVDEMLDEGLEVQFLYVKYGHRDTSYGQSVLAREGCVK